MQPLKRNERNMYSLKTELKLWNSFWKTKRIDFSLRSHSFSLWDSYDIYIEKNLQNLKANSKREPCTQSPGSNNLKTKKSKGVRTFSSLTALPSPCALPKVRSCSNGEWGLGLFHRPGVFSKKSFPSYWLFLPQLSCGALEGNKNFFKKSSVFVPDAVNSGLLFLPAYWFTPKQTALSSQWQWL